MKPFFNERSVAARLSDLPFGGLVRRVLLLAGASWLVEAFDIGLIGVVLVVLTKLWSLSPAQVGLLAAASTVGIAIGVIPSGLLADRFGRKPVLIWPLVWYTALTLLAAFSPSLKVLLILRFLAGLGMGAMFPIPYTLASEFVAKNRRGAAAGLLDAFLSIGYFIAPVLAVFLIPSLPRDVGWRLLFIAGGVPMILALVLQRNLPESPRWLAARGDRRKALAVLVRLESELGTKRVCDIPHGGEETFVARPALRVSELLRGGLRTRTLMIWVAFPAIFFVFYGISNFIPSTLTADGFDEVGAFGLAALIMAVSIPGKLFEAWAVEVLGRKVVIVGFTVIAALAALLLGLVPPGARTGVVMIASVMSFFGVSVDAAVKTYTTEQYPTDIRATGTAFTEGLGRFIGGALAPFFMALVIGRWGASSGFILVSAVAFVGAGAVAFFGRETKNRPLEDVSAP